MDHGLQDHAQVARQPEIVDTARCTCLARQGVGVWKYELVLLALRVDGVEFTFLSSFRQLVGGKQWASAHMNPYYELEM